MRMTDWAYAQGVYVTNAYCWYREGALPPSGAEGRSADPAASVVVVGHRDRLGRMNVGLARAALAPMGAVRSWWMSASRPMTW